MSVAEVQILMPPKFEALEERYDAIIRDICLRAQRDMKNQPVEVQTRIRDRAIEQARPFCEEVGRIRALTIPSFVVKL